MITREQYDAAQVAKKAAEETIHQYLLEETKRGEERLGSGQPFTDDELIYAARTLCPCGHGLAYPKKNLAANYWDCSAIWKGIADKSVKHTDKLPFAFYEIKSENQPSAAGATTRGAFKPKPADSVPP